MNKELKNDLLSNMSDKDIFTKYPFISSCMQLRELYIEAVGEC